MSLKKFSRGANYSEEEKILLFSVINRYLGVIENKKTNAASAREKDRAWAMIAVEYNAKSKSYRSKLSLKTCYVNLKKAARKTQKFKTDGQKPNSLHKTVFLMMPGPAMPLAARVVTDASTTLYNLNAERVSDSVAQEDGEKATDATEDLPNDALTMPRMEESEYIAEDAGGMSPNIVSEPDGWCSSYSVKRSRPTSPYTYKSPSFHPHIHPQQRLDPMPRPPDTLAEVRLEILREDVKRRRTQEEEDYRMRKRVEQEEADIRIQILKTELLIKKEVLKQEIKKTNAMDNRV